MDIIGEIVKQRNEELLKESPNGNLITRHEVITELLERFVIILVGIIIVFVIWISV